MIVCSITTTQAENANDVPIVQEWSGDYPVDQLNLLPESQSESLKFFAQSPGRIGCGESENLCIGSTHQKDFRRILQRLAELKYVQRIDESFLE
jgi:hypothetical protein